MVISANDKKDGGKEDGGKMKSNGDNITSDDR